MQVPDLQIAIIYFDKLNNTQFCIYPIITIGNFATSRGASNTWQGRAGLSGSSVTVTNRTQVCSEGK